MKFITNITVMKSINMMGTVRTSGEKWLRFLSFGSTDKNIIINQLNTQQKTLESYQSNR
jgi:hypothetical protein